MQRKLLFFSSLIYILCGNKVVAQAFNCGHSPLDCSVNPVVPLFSDENISVQYGIKYAVKNKLADISYKNANPFLDDCGNVVPLNCKMDQGDILVYDVYYPSEKTAYHCYKDKPLPAIVLFHGGGFSDCNDSDFGGNIDNYCREFAKRGFVAFDVHYRSGRLKDPNFVNGDVNNNYFSASAFLATYRAFQDGRGAIRSIIAYQSSPTPPAYSIDPDNVFVGGVSSGGIIAMSIAYYTPDMLYEIFGDAKYKLGTLDDSSYRGPGTVKFKIKGVLDLWGGAYVPAAYASAPETFFKKNRSRSGINLNPPMIAFQGALDVTVPVNKANIYFSSDSFFRTATVCASQGTNFSLPNNDADGAAKDLVLFGTQGFYNILTRSIGVPAELYLDSDMKHGLSNTSNFGTNINVQNNKTLIIPYLVERAASFFQAVENSVAANLQDTKFVDCENYRYGCSVDNNHANCINATLAKYSDNITTNKPVEKPLFTLSQSNHSVHIYLNNPGAASISLFDLYGRPVKNPMLTNNTQTTIDCHQLTRGIYYVRVSQGNTTQTKKVSIY